MSPATIQSISAITPHGNADTLDFASVLGFRSIVKRSQFSVGDVVCFIVPDSQLPDKPWAAPYKAKSSRVRAIKLRGSWSEGVIEKLDTVGYTGPIEIGRDISADIGVTHWEAPQPQDLSAIGGYPYGIPRTDEERVSSLDVVPYGELVDVTLKIDGQNWNAFVKLYLDTTEERPVERGVGGRSFLYQLDTINNYTRNEQQYDVLNKLEAFCRNRGVSLCLRGESYGVGIQKFAINPHAKLPVSLALFSTWLIDERRYATKGDPFYIHTIAPQMGLPTVPMLEHDVPLTRELIAKYEEGLETIDGKPFEGVVINWAGGSFKIINRYYDSLK